MVVLIKITATCPALGVTELQFTITPDGKLFCAATSIIYDPLVTSFDNSSRTVIVTLPGTHIGWLSVPIVAVPTGLSLPLMRCWCFFNLLFYLFLFLVISLM